MGITLLAAKQDLPKDVLQVRKYVSTSDSRGPDSYTAATPLCYVDVDAWLMLSCLLSCAVHPGSKVTITVPLFNKKYLDSHIIE